MSFMPQSCRERLSGRDFEFMATMLNQVDPSKEDAFMRLALDPDTLDTLLDHPQLLQSVLSMKQPITVSAELYFYVLVRHALKESGIDHRVLADYVASAMVEFANGNPWKTSPDDALQIDGVPYYIDFIEAINSASAYDRFYLHVRCGNQFLVLTGMFPDFVKQRAERRGAPGVRFYEQIACQSYATARNHPLADEFDLCEVYDLLTSQFRETRKALNRMTREYMWLG